MYLRGYKLGLLSVIKAITVALAAVLIAGVSFPAVALSADDAQAQQPLRVFTRPDSAYHLSVYEKSAGFNVVWRRRQ